MKRRVKDSVGRCKVCGSDAVLSRYGMKYADRKKRWSVVCSNPVCRKTTPGYDDPKDALAAWAYSWGK